MYGVPSSAGQETGSKPVSSASRGRKEPPVAAAAYVLVRNHPVAATPWTVKTTAEAAVDGAEGPAELKVITLAEATKYLESGTAIFVDARSAQRFAMGHVPGALNVPSSDFDGGFDRNGPRLPRDGKIIVYCESASCDQAEEVANKLMEKGFRRLMHFKDGWLVWEFSDMVQERGAER